MKHLVVTLAALLGMSVSLSAQADLKIVTVNMAALFDGYYLAQEGSKKLESAFANAQEQADAFMKAGQELVQELQTIADQLENPALSEDAKAEIQKKAQAKQAEVQEKQRELGRWERDMSNQLQERRMTFRMEMIDEIKRVVAAHASSIDASLVFDTSDIIGSGVPPLLFSDPSLDITDQVLEELNRDAPPPSAEPAPAADAAAAQPAN